MAEVHLLSDIEEARCECVLKDGHTGSHIIEDVTCVRCLRMYMDEQIITMEAEFQSQLQDLRKQFQLLLKVVAEKGMEKDDWCGLVMDMNYPMNADGSYPWKSASCYIPKSAQDGLTSTNLVILGGHGSYTIKEAMETRVEDPEPKEEAPSFYDHLLK